MSLYHIQDNDEPIWVIASSYDEAIKKWQSYHSRDDVEPERVCKVCDDEELIK
jgi:hypothetical protein